MDSSAFFQYPSDSEGNGRFLGDLRDDEVRVVLGYTQARRYPRGQAAIREGEMHYSLFLITAGRFEVVKHTPYGARRTTILQAGEIFGLQSFLDHQPSTANVRAVDDSEVVVLSPTGFDRLRLAQPQLALRLVLHLARIFSLRFREHERSLTTPDEL